MPLIVYKSQLGEADFAAEVEAYRQALLAHRFTGDAAPHAHSLVEAAVKRVPCEGGPDDFVADFEIVDDTPAPPSAADRKAALVGRLLGAEAAALEAVMPAGKLRLLSIQAGATDETGKPLDQEAVERLREVSLKRYEIQLHSATVHAWIDDLPEDKIDTFEIPAFPG